MKERTKLEAMGDIAMSVIPVAGSVYHGRKNHKEGFIEASKLYEKKFKELSDQKRQIRMMCSERNRCLFVLSHGTRSSGKTNLRCLLRSNTRRSLMLVNC